MKKEKTSVFAISKRLFKYLGKKKYLLLLVFFFVIYSSFANIFGSLYMGKIIDQAISNKDLNELGKKIIILVSVYSLGVLSDIAYTQIMINISQNVLYNLRNELMNHTLHLPLMYFDKVHHGKIMSYFTNDVDTLINALNDSFANIILCFSNIIGTIVVLLLINVYLTLIVLLFMIGIALFIYFNTKDNRKYYRESQEAISEINASVEENILSLKEINSFNHQKESYDNFDKINSNWLDKSTKSFFHTQLTIPVNVSLSFIEFSVCSLIGIFFLVNNLLTGIGALTSFIVSVRQSVQPFNFFTNHLNNLLTALTGIERIFTFLDNKKEEDNGTISLVKIDNKYAFKDLKNNITFIKGEIEFNHVSFSYNTNKKVIDDISFKIKEGNSLALVGATGSGKTTIISLLNRLYNINEGNITIDGINIKDIKLTDLRKTVFVISQDAHFFTGSILENIRYSRMHSTYLEVINASKIAHADYFITHLKDGYNTILYGDGSNISQGERQLLCLARVALAKRPIIVLDEVTSNIDTKNEKIIQESLSNIIDNKTMIVIAHRLSTVKNSNIILYLENGKIIEKGTNEELLKLKGKYYKLYYGLLELE